MGSIFILGMVGIPAALCLLWFLTPKGQAWLRKNGMV